MNSGENTKRYEPALTYSSYLKIDELLQLQRPRSTGPEHDEMLFIIVHQTYELWFKC
ncbi:MAG: tryptophan 2,3-dioxygenase family protein, partial [Acidimicrobiaceae bacterium]